MITFSTPQDNTMTIDSCQVHRAGIDVLQESFSEIEINGYKYTHNQVWDVLVYASANGISVKSVCESLENAPSYNWIYTQLKDEVFDRYSLETLESRGNEALAATFPNNINANRVKVAIDLVLIPFYRSLTTAGIYRSQAKCGTTKFFCYAWAYLIKKNKRVTLAFTCVGSDDTLLAVLKRLLSGLDDLGIGLKRLYLDPGFAGVLVFKYLEVQSYVSIVALPKRGKRLQAIQSGKQSRITNYTMKSHKHGEITFSVWLPCRYRKGRANKHGVQYLFFAVLGACRSPVVQVADEYRHRFGIEASYRIMNQTRAITTSTHQHFRVLQVIVALLLANIWVWLKWTMTLMSRRKRRATPIFTVNLFCLFITEAIKDIYKPLRDIKL